MIEWTTAASLTARAGSTAYQHRHTLNQWWKMALAYLNKGNTNILVTGRPNVGKTILVEQMLGEAGSMYHDQPEASNKVEVEAVTIGKWTQLIRTLPGQSSSTRSMGINDAFDDNKDLKGVIHVVDFGYTTPRDPATAASLIKDQKIEKVENLRNFNLESENREIIKIVSIIEQSITRQSTPKWILIAVNKVDIFYESLNEALSYYHPLGTSHFSKTLRELQHKVGSDKLKIYVTQTCADLGDFKWDKEEVKSKINKEQQKKILRDYINVLATISEGAE